jgi:hypothetical protein
MFIKVEYTNYLQKLSKTAMTLKKDSLFFKMAFLQIFVGSTVKGGMNIPMWLIIKEGPVSMFHDPSSAPFKLS